MQCELCRKSKARGYVGGIRVCGECYKNVRRLKWLMNKLK